MCGIQKVNKFDKHRRWKYNQHKGNMREVFNVLSKLHTILQVVKRGKWDQKRDLNRVGRFRYEHFSLNADTKDPVSYTHLDVYKRQPINEFILHLPMYRL